MRLRAAAVLVLTALALLGVAALESDDPRRPNAAAAAAAATRVPLLGVVGHPRPNSLARLHPRTLRPVSRRIRLRGELWTSAWSPDRRRLALAVSTTSGSVAPRSRIQIVDVERWRTTAVIDITDHNEAAWIAWSSPRRVLAVATGGHSVIAVDPFAGRIVRATRFRELVVGDSVRPAGDGLAMLLGPVQGIGPATLALVSGDARLRRVPLEGIEAGFEHPETDQATDEMPVGRSLMPALAVDGAAGKAYVVEAGGPGIVDVELASGEATRHEPDDGRTALEWLRDLVEGEAEAKMTEGPWRIAHALGDGMLAVSGWTDTVHGDRPRARPHGLHMIDTREWTAETVDERVSWFVPAPGALVVADGGYGRNSGVVALELDGSRRFRLLAGRDASATAVGGLLYVTSYRPSRTHVVDLRSGRTVRALPPGEPPLLIPPPVR
jgi:hypothetical protein